MLATLWLMASLAEPVSQPASNVWSVHLSHEGDDSLGTQFVTNVGELLQTQGVRVSSSRAADSHTLVMLSIRAVGDRTSRQFGSVIALALLRPDNTFVKLWVYTLNHTPGHVNTQAGDLVRDLVKIR
jgi:hypothetical protein